MTGPTHYSAPRRLVSLDVLRGLTIAFMIMVNNPGGDGAWTEMRHAEWNGFTATDLVFPTFLFVVGASIVFSIRAHLNRGDSRAKLACGIRTFNRSRKPLTRRGCLARKLQVIDIRARRIESMERNSCI